MLYHLHPWLATTAWQHLRRMGGPGLVVLGIADTSVIPLTGSMDVLTIWLAAHHREPWPYYALMATIGAVLGGYITYSLARKGGKQAMERRLSKRRAAKVYKEFERWGAGAMQYSQKKFLGALVLGRGVRYTIVAGLGALYGRHIVRFFSRYDKPALAVLIVLAVVAGVLSLIQYLRYRRGASAVVVRHSAA